MMFEENFAHDSLTLKAHRPSLLCGQGALTSSVAIVLFFTAEDSLETEDDCRQNALPDGRATMLQ